MCEGISFPVLNTESLINRFSHHVTREPWRHLNFFEYPCYIHADLPRKCGICNHILQVKVLKH